MGIALGKWIVITINRRRENEIAIHIPWFGSNIGIELQL